MRLWISIVLTCGVALMPDAETLIGSREPCSNEGELVNVENIKDIRCFTCMCKNGFVECEKEQCPSLQGCHRVLDMPKDSCCRKCKGCMYFGEVKESGSEWRDPQNPCRVLSCKAGVVTETEEKCYISCQNPLPPRQGQCCPTCPGCRVNGQQVSAESTVRVLEDPCVRCQCNSGRLSCSKKACPVLHCPPASVLKRPGDCCPTCTGTKRLFEPPAGRCLLGSNLVAAGQNLHLDRCTLCQCTNGTSVCWRPSCPVLDCPVEIQITDPRQCCPHCPPMSSIMKFQSVCSLGGKNYSEGETWQLDQCKSCVCKQGQIRCAMEMCTQINVPCPPNHKLTKLPGQCCPKCVESDRVCTVFGDPHYRTFDGKFFSFQGSCKYQLTADCVDHTFSIRVTNDARSTKTSSWTKTVSLKVGDLKVNLGERRRVKINSVKVGIPHERKGVKVTEADDSVLVETEIGVKVLWDGNSFLEVSVPPKYKGKLCGLCGNFNSISKDDFTTRRGHVVYDADKFGTSWRVGGKRACTRQSDTPPHCSQNLPHKRYRDRLCKPLRSDVFAPCHKKLNFMMYFKSCLIDMCECPSRRCYCESFTAYAHECKRLGVTLPDWRSATGCLARH